MDHKFLIIFSYSMYNVAMASASAFRAISLPCAPTMVTSFLATKTSATTTCPCASVCRAMSCQILLHLGISSVKMCQVQSLSQNHVLRSNNSHTAECNVDLI